MNPDPNLCRQKKDDGKNSIDLLIIVASGPPMFIYPVFISILSSFFSQLYPRLQPQPDLPCCAVARVIEQCCFNSTPDPDPDPKPILI